MIIPKKAIRLHVAYLTIITALSGIIALIEAAKIDYDKERQMSGVAVLEKELSIEGSKVPLLDEQILRRNNTDDEAAPAIEDLVEIPRSSIPFFVRALTKSSLNLKSNSGVSRALELDSNQIDQINTIIDNQLKFVQEYELSRLQFVEGGEDAYFLLPSVKSIWERKVKPSLEASLGKLNFSPELRMLLFTSIVNSLPDFNEGEREVSLLFDVPGSADPSDIYLDIIYNDTKNSSRYLVSANELSQRYGHLFH